MAENIQILRTPTWLKRPIPRGNMVTMIRTVVHRWNLHTVCESAACPNRQECYSKGRLTFMILGTICTRNCSFCKVQTGRPLPPDPDEPQRLCHAVEDLGLRYVVITSVCRDDLADGGATQFAEVIDALHHNRPDIEVEVLIPDFRGSSSALQTVVATQPAVLNHNVETVPRLYSEVRPQAKYERSLEVLKRAKASDKRLLTKSGLMLGLGERKDEVIAVMQDLREAECDFITLGQYMRPSLKHHEVARYVTPDEFAEFQVIAREIGFLAVASGPLVRSSFNALDLLNRVNSIRSANHSV